MKLGLKEQILTNGSAPQDSNGRRYNRSPGTDYISERVVSAKKNKYRFFHYGAVATRNPRFWGHYFFHYSDGDQTGGETNRRGFWVLLRNNHDHA